MAQLNGRGKRNNAGFTMVEMLLAVAVLVILFSVSSVAVVSYRNSLKITELDNAAREIYMAAQNRAVLLRNNERLMGLTMHSDNVGGYKNRLEAEGNRYYYFVHSGESDILQELLPAEAIESSLWDGVFYIVYEPVSGSVTDVFYAEEDFLLTGTFSQDWYDTYRVMAKKDRMKLDPMLGYYGGEPAASGDAYTLRTPVINIHNEDTLTAEVTYWVPRSLSSVENDIQISIVLHYLDYPEVELCRVSTAELPVGLKSGSYGDRLESGRGGDIYNVEYTVSCLLDSLNEGQQFQDFWPEKKGEKRLGEDFTLTASIAYLGTERMINGAEQSASDNSLFAKTSAGNRADIAYMRHLQNLHPAFSNVENTKTEALQVRDIWNTMVPGVSGRMAAYAFYPIDNKDLTVYNGAGYMIRNLYIDEEKKTAGGTAWTYTGLFAQFGGRETVGTPVELRGIRLVNPIVQSDSGTAAGGRGSNYTGTLCGLAQNARISDCRTYWVVDDENETNLQYLLGTSAEENYLIPEASQKYKVSGQTAGGLVGYARNCEISRSLAATTVKGDQTAGGLIGRGSLVKIEESYADCYLAAPRAAGLVGTMEQNGGAGKSEITGCYTAGFISIPDAGSGEIPGAMAAGLYLRENGSGEGAGVLGAGESPASGGSVTEAAAAVSGSYSAMTYSKPEGSVINRYPVSNDLGTYASHTCYLHTAYVNNSEKNEGVSSKDYNALTDFTNNGAELFGADNCFERKTVSGSHPYNLQKKLALADYPYPGIKGLDHYGDWRAEFQIGSMVYWEEYAEDSGFGFFGAGANTLRSTGLVKNDGYAVVLSQEFVMNAAGDTIAINYQEEGKETASLSYRKDELQAVTITSEGTNETYYLAKLPEKQMHIDAPAVPDDFYQKITITLNDSTKPFQYLFNPHFAATMVRIDDSIEISVKELAQNLQVRVRSPRHLYELSHYEAYFASSNNYIFLQELDLDYSKYSGYGMFTESGSRKQKSIGTDPLHAFLGTYNGQSHTIVNVPLELDQSSQKLAYIGLFGYNTGAIRNVVYLGSGREKRGKDGAAVVSGNAQNSSLRYVGTLAGGNSGTITNCAVAYVGMNLTSYGYSTLYAGGLVGVNYGTISNSSAVLDWMEADTNYSNAYMGGFVGQNAAGASITNCYAIGDLKASRYHDGVVAASGFAGQNLSILSNSYAAADLTVNGGAEAYGFCPESSSNCYYLNSGNFEYLNELYSAQYRDGSDNSGRTWAQMTEPDETNRTVDLLGDAFQMNGRADNLETYPYPAVVKNVASGEAVHYGDWPKQLVLGTFGVFYWEKEIIYADQVGADGKKIELSQAYHFSAIAVDPNKVNTTKRWTTLCREHSDGGVVEEYGYGYFYDNHDERLKDGRLKFEYSSGDIQLSDVQTDVGNELSKLTGGDYAFVAYLTTYAGKENTPNTYLKGSNTTTSIWTLKLPVEEASGDEKEYSFYVNPFFAESFSLTERNDVKIDAEDADSLVGPLGTENIPFGVRSVEQLRYINWYYKTDEDKGTDKVNTSSDKDNFPYLCSVTRVLNIYSWHQSHDINGCKSYGPIAAFCDRENADISQLYGWFGGIYDGNHYTMIDMQISSDESNSVGLFGVTINATLKNIILYAQSDNISIQGISKKDELTKSWRALGGLVGLAASGGNGEEIVAGGEISNCSISGYSIKGNFKNLAFGGGGIGGLVGFCNLDLKGCTSVVNIQVCFENAEKDDSRNVRIGGLVGASQSSISYCYSGGKIEIDADTQDKYRLHIGGIVGGSYMKPLQIKLNNKSINISDTTTDKSKAGNSLHYCYTYTVLPNISLTGNNTNTMYYVGGVGELGGFRGERGYLSDSYENCYYLLEDAVNLQNKEVKDENAVTGISYEVMAGYSKDSGSNDFFLNVLNRGLDRNYSFSTVTTKIPGTDSDISGRYSYVTSDKLKGMNYPFPTILKQGDNNVHYGDWPLPGIERSNGAAPVNIDLFADYDKETEESSKTVKLTLSDLLKSTIQGRDTGKLVITSLEADSGSDSAAGAVTAGFRTIDLGKENLTASIVINSTNKADEFELVLTGHHQGSARIVVEYQEDGISAISETILVNVTANMQLLPVVEQETVDTAGNTVSGIQRTKEGEPVIFVSSDHASEVHLYPYDMKVDSEPLPESLQEKITISNIQVVYDTAHILTADASLWNLAAAEEASACQLLLAAKGKTIGATAMTVKYDYTYRDVTYSGSSTINATVAEVELIGKPLDLYLDNDGEESSDPAESDKLKKYAKSNYVLTVNGKNTEGDESVIENLQYMQVLSNPPDIAQARLEDGKIMVEGFSPGTAMMFITGRFAYGGSVHELTVYVDVVVHGLQLRGDMARDQITLYRYDDGSLPEENSSAQITASVNTEEKTEYTYEIQAADEEMQKLLEQYLSATVDKSEDVSKQNNWILTLALKDTSKTSDEEKEEPGGESGSNPGSGRASAPGEESSEPEVPELIRAELLITAKVTSGGKERVWRKTLQVDIITAEKEIPNVSGGDAGSGSVSGGDAERSTNGSNAGPERSVSNGNAEQSTSGSNVGPERSVSGGNAECSVSGANVGPLEEETIPAAASEVSASDLFPASAGYGAQSGVLAGLFGLK